MDDLTQLTDEQLADALRAADADREAAAARARLVHDEIERRGVVAAAVATVETMTDAQKAAMAQALGVAGTPPATVIGGGSAA